MQHEQALMTLGSDPIAATAQSSTMRRWLRLRSRRRLLSLALQGGGSFGAFTWGVLDHLLETEGVAFDAVSGTSAGAVNAVVLANGLAQGGPDEARRQLTHLCKRLSRAPPPASPGSASPPSAPTESAPLLADRAARGADRLQQPAAEGDRGARRHARAVQGQRPVSLGRVPQARALAPAPHRRGGERQRPASGERAAARLELPDAAQGERPSRRRGVARGHAAPRDAAGRQGSGLRDVTVAVTSPRLPATNRWTCGATVPRPSIRRCGRAAASSRRPSRRCAGTSPAAC